MHARVVARVGLVVLGPRGQTDQPEREEATEVKAGQIAGAIAAMKEDQLMVQDLTNDQVAIGQAGRAVQVAMVPDQIVVAIDQLMVRAGLTLGATTEATVGHATVALVETDSLTATRTESKIETAGHHAKGARIEDLMNAETTQLQMGPTSQGLGQFSASGPGPSGLDFREG